MSGIVFDGDGAVGFRDMWLCAVDSHMIFSRAIVYRYVSGGYGRGPPLGAGARDINKVGIGCFGRIINKELV